jgi:hypothetical protein
MRCAVFSRPATWRYAHVGGDFDLSGTFYQTLDLTGATVDKDMTIQSADCGKGQNGRSDELFLSNLQVGRLLVPSRTALPFRLHLEGFSASDVGRDDDRNADKWLSVIALDHDFSPHPYRRIAATFAAAGDHYSADWILAVGRFKELDQAFHTTAWGRWLVLLAIGVFAGFGVYSFWAVTFWIMTTSLLGGCRLQSHQRAFSTQVTPGHGFAWCCCASFFRVLPLPDVKEFKEFFDRELPKMRWFDKSYFLFLSVFGWLLAAVLAAAVSGIMEKS